MGIAVGALLAVVIFGRRVQRNVYRKADGQPGAAAWALENLRGRWRVTPAVAGTTQLDAVHRVHRPAGRRARRRGCAAPGQGAARAGEEAGGARRRRDADLRRDRRQRRGPGPAAQAAGSPHEAAAQHLQPPRSTRMEKRLAALASRGAALPKGPMPQGAKMRNVQRTHAPPLVSASGRRRCLPPCRAGIVRPRPTPAPGISGKIRTVRRIARHGPTILLPSIRATRRPNSA